MEPENGDLEDVVPFQLGDFKVPALNFRSTFFQLGIPWAYPQPPTQ